MIKNNVIWSTYLYRTEFKNFQWDLKKQDNDEEISKLAKRILKWFDAPIYVWYEHDNYILDWHQRLKALNKLADEWHLLEDDKIPVVYIKADTEQEAKEKVLEYNSKYSEFDMQELWIFAEDLDLDWINVEWLDIEIWLDNIYEDFSLPDWDKWEIETVSFTLHSEQAKQVREAIDIAKWMWEFLETWNKNSNWNALARVCEIFITQNI